MTTPISEVDRARYFIDSIIHHHCKQRPGHRRYKDYWFSLVTCKYKLIPIPPTQQCICQSCERTFTDTKTHCPHCNKPRYDLR